MIGRVQSACLLVALLAAAGCSAASPTGAGPVRPTARPFATPTPAPTGPYVAIGDSYTAGLQLQPSAGGPDGCGRSAVNYPSLVAKDLKLTGGDFTDVSCAGATTADLTAAQRVDGGANPAQLDRLTPGTRLVTLGIGGNDANFTKVMARCAEEGVAQALIAALDPRQADASPCRAFYTSGGTDQLTTLLNTVGDRLAAVLAEVHRRAPQARVYVVGYPALLPADPAPCTAVLGKAVPAGDLAFLAEKEQQLNGVLRARATAAGVGFVDTYTPSAGHDMCAGEAERWVEPPFPAPGRAPLHPNAAGQQGMAQAVLHTLRG
ncbi:SGNH/GDSL hydrolase family protein [Kitasatospora nipponensis]|uniref:SGNH/GDSL hydrolase family protein n=1 Tax=Kitasatospora nipponensis TaxID=258049 RepID=A0ABP4G6X6_9ACTN